MVQIRTKVTLRRRGNLANHIAKIEKAVKGPTSVKAGFPAGRAGKDIVQIAVWQHFGTAGSGKPFKTERGGGFGGPIPPRPFITVAMFKGRRQVRNELRKQAYDITVNGKPMAQALFALGSLGRDLIQKQITSNMGPPNSPTTIRLKGSSGTLRDSGNMFQALTWAVDQ